MKERNAKKSRDIATLIKERADRDPGWLFHVYPVWRVRVLHPRQPRLPTEHRCQGDHQHSLSHLFKYKKKN